MPVYNAKAIEAMSKRQVITFLIAGNVISAIILGAIVLRFRDDRIFGLGGGVFLVWWITTLWVRSIRRLRALELQTETPPR
jgi:hypothetical protein